MRVLIGCERSGIVRDAFNRRGHHAISCDLEPDENHSKDHWCLDIFDALAPDRWDLIILHPPCQHLAVCGNKHWAGSIEREQAIGWTLALFNAARDVAPSVALENPVGVLSSAWRKPDQYVQPWQYGHGETKKTGLWLRNLPKLRPTDIVPGREQRVWRMPPSPTRATDRARTYTGIANAMAEQWRTTDDE